jgi:hypothetical protein
VVSLNVDPDGMFSQRHAGIVCQGSVEHMAEEVRRLAAEPERRALFANRLARYVAEHHSLAGRCDELCEVIEAAVRSAEAPPARVIHAPTPTRSASEDVTTNSPSLALRVSVRAANFYEHAHFLAGQLSAARYNMIVLIINPGVWGR